MMNRAFSSGFCGAPEAPRAHRGRSGLAVSVVVVAMVIGGLVSWGSTSQGPADSTSVPDRAPAQVAATSGHNPFELVASGAAGDVRLPLAEFSDGVAHYYTFMAGGLPVEFFVILTPDNVVRTAYNACDVCYRAKLGYRQDRAFMVCNNCGNRFPVEKIDTVNGGCNPAPLTARIEEQELVISSDALTLGLTYFP